MEANHQGPKISGGRGSKAMTGRVKGAKIGERAPSDYSCCSRQGSFGLLGDPTIPDTVSETPEM